VLTTILVGAVIFLVVIPVLCLLYGFIYVWFLLKVMDTLDKRG